jgi:hypothetical protein
MEPIKKNEAKKPLPAYHILVDRDNIKVDKECLSGREILSLAGKTPIEKYQLNIRRKGGKVTKVGYDDTICLTEPGIEKFLTLPLDQTEGENLRRDFSLLEEDEEFLEGLGLPWEAAKFQNASWIFIHGFPIRQGYNIGQATIGIWITPSYPVAQLDMVNALSNLLIDGKSFQRWSRHRTPQNPWRPGLDSLATHVPLVSFWLEQEFIKRPGHAKSA